MNLGYILQVKLTGQVEKLDAEGRGKDGGREQIFINDYAQVFECTNQKFIGIIF